MEIPFETFVFLIWIRIPFENHPFCCNYNWNQEKKSNHKNATYLAIKLFDKLLLFWDLQKKLTNIQSVLIFFWGYFKR